MGGPVCIEAANRVPEQILGLVLVDNLENIEMSYSPETIAYIDTIMMDLVTNPAREKVEGVFYKKNKDVSYKRILSMLLDTPKIGWKESLHENFRWVNEDCKKALNKIQVPIIAINSDAQATNVDAFRKVVPSYKVKIISEVGHVVFWDKPEEFNMLLEESIQEFVNRIQ